MRTVPARTAAHPPAASTTLLVALGRSRPAAQDGFSIMVAVAIVGVMSGVFRRLRMAGGLRGGLLK